MTRSQHGELYSKIMGLNEDEYLPVTFKTVGDAVLFATNFVPSKSNHRRGMRVKRVANVLYFSYIKPEGGE